MKIYLVQHGNQNPEAIDPQEGLSEKGRTDCNKVSEFSVKAGVKPSKIFHSVKLRAKQTAEIFAHGFNCKTEEKEGLKPMDDVTGWQEKLEDGLMLVGHLPFMTKFSALLLCGNSKKEIIKFQQGGIVCLEKNENGNWNINFMITPDLW